MKNKRVQLKQLNKKNGFVGVLLIVILLAASLVIASGVSFVAFGETFASRQQVDSSRALLAAEGALEDAILRIIDPDLGDPSFPYESNPDGASVVVSQEALQGGEKKITSRADFNGKTRSVEAVIEINSSSISFHYGAQAGEGGVVMEENSRIEGAGGQVGNLYSNGPVSGDNGATITGDITVATGISLGDSSMVCNADQIAGQNNPQIDFAQSFKASGSKPLSKVGLYIKKVGSPGDRTVRITNDNNGSPAQTSIASATLDAGLVGAGYAWIDVVFSSPPNLIQNNTYWLVLDASQNSSKYWVWCKDNNNGYAGGVGKYKQDWDSGGSWSSIVGDLTFKTYLGTGESSIDDIVVYGNVRANTITDSKICGDAYYQSTSNIDASSKNFLDNPTNPTCPNPLTPGTGYPDQPDPPVSPMPISQANIDQWEIDAESGGVISGDYNVTNNVNLGPKKITGNLIITGNNKTLTVTGTIYVQGNIDIDNGSTIKCASSYEENSCVILADGWIHIKNNSQFQGSGTTGSYAMILTTISGCNGGDQQPQCTHHNAAMDLHNNATGAIFYAANSMINLHNGVNATEISAYKIELDNNAVVTYEQGLINAQFSSGPGASWNLINWQEVE